MAERNALNVGFRASMLPIGNYEDGSLAFPVWPQSAVDAGNALMRFHRGEPPQPQDAVLAGLAMTGAGIGGLGARAAESGAARFAANPKEAAPAGLLATSGLERMQAEDAVRPPSSPTVATLPPASQFIPETIAMDISRGGPLSPRGLEYRDQLVRMLETPVNESTTLHAGGAGAAPGAILSGDQSVPGFDEAFAELHQALIDLDGDGVPDVAVPRNALMGGGQAQPPQTMGNALARGYNNANFPSGGQLPNYGFGDPSQMSKMGMTPEGSGSISGPAPRPQEYTAPLAEMTPPPIPGGQFIARAAPRVAGALAGGLGMSAMISDAGEAGAPRLTRSQQRQMEMERQRSEQDATNARARIEAETQAARQRGEDDARIAAERRQREQQQAEYEAQVGRATAARDFELSRDRRFSDTGMGRALDNLGGADALASGAVSGLVGRAVTGPARGIIGDVVKNYMLPAVEGAIGGFTAANLPLWYDANKTEVENPEKRAARAYARELPQGHPRKQEFMDYANSLPDKNPVREQAAREFREGLGDRAISGGLEGAGAGVFGGNVARGLAGAGNALLGAVRRGNAPQARTIVRATDRNGRIYHYDAATGNRVPNP